MRHWGILCDIMWYNDIWYMIYDIYEMIWYDIIRYDMIWYDTFDLIYIGWIKFPCFRVCSGPMNPLAIDTSPRRSISREGVTSVLPRCALKGASARSVLLQPTQHFPENPWQRHWQHHMLGFLSISCRGSSEECFQMAFCVPNTLSQVSRVSS